MKRELLEVLRRLAAKHGYRSPDEIYATHDGRPWWAR